MVAGTFFFAYASGKRNGRGGIKGTRNNEIPLKLLFLTLLYLFSGIITSVISNLDTKRILLQQKLDGMLRYMRGRNVSLMYQSKKEF